MPPKKRKKKKKKRMICLGLVLNFLSLPPEIMI
jgi:hypothetical protein